MYSVVQILATWKTSTADRGEMYLRPHNQGTHALDDIDAVILVKGGTTTRQKFRTASWYGRAQSSELRCLCKLPHTSSVFIKGNFWR